MQQLGLVGECSVRGRGREWQRASLGSRGEHKSERQAAEIHEFLSISHPVHADAAPDEYLPAMHPLHVHSAKAPGLSHRHRLES